MFLIYGQFYNQTRLSWDWQQIGGTATYEEDAHAFAYRFAVNYRIPCKLVGRKGVTIYLPPVAEFGNRHDDSWPQQPEHAQVIVTH